MGNDDKLVPKHNRRWSRRHITNRWSSRLRGRLEVRVLSRREQRLLAVVGGAAQLYDGAAGRSAAGPPSRPPARRFPGIRFDACPFRAIRRPRRLHGDTRNTSNVLARRPGNQKHHRRQNSGISPKGRFARRLTLRATTPRSKPTRRTQSNLCPAVKGYCRYSETSSTASRFRQIGLEEAGCWEMRRKRASRSNLPGSCEGAPRSGELGMGHSCRALETDRRSRRRYRE